MILTTMQKLKHVSVIALILTTVVLVKIYVKSHDHSDQDEKPTKQSSSLQQGVIIAQDHLFTAPASQQSQDLPVLFPHNQSVVVTKNQFDSLMQSRSSLLRSVCNKTTENNRKFYIRQFYALQVNQNFSRICYEKF